MHKVNTLVKKLVNNHLRFFLYPIIGKKYIRKGSCKACGSCCKNISIKHGRKFVDSLEQFETLQRRFSMYRMFKVMEQAEVGLVFQCVYLDDDTGKCTNYTQRPPLCKNYPNEVIFSLGGSLYQECGFEFVPIKSFDKVLSEVQKSK